MKLKTGITLLTGFILITAAVSASIFFKFYYWYTFYLLGVFMFFGTLNYFSGSPSVFVLILKNKWKQFSLIYGVGLVVGFVVDIVYGRSIASLWLYPHLKGVSSFFFPVIFYYPFGALHVYEIYYFIRSLLSKYVSTEKNINLPDRFKQLMSSGLILLMVFGLIVPILNFYFNNNRYANEIMVIVMIATTFSLDAVIYKINKTSILFEFIQANLHMMSTMIVSMFIIAFFTEFPNTYSWEWVYTNIPFIKTEFLRINILLFTFGYFFLTFVPVRCIDLIKVLFKKYYE